MANPTTEVRRLRQWLHRIEEACISKAPTPEQAAIRAAALAALKGAQAPTGCGQLQEA